MSEAKIDKQQLLAELYSRVVAGTIDLPAAIKMMRRISGLSQIEFAKHRGISVNALRQLESNQGNPTIETLNKVASVFGLQVGLVPKR